MSEATTVNDPEYEDCPTVALIGCRPSGMSFLHSLESRKMNEIRHRNTSKSWPRVVCFEASSGHGGLWRPNESKQNDTDEQSQIYSDVWCNIPKESVEFYDYTYKENFSAKKNNLCIYIEMLCTNILRKDQRRLILTFSQKILMTITKTIKTTEYCIIPL